MTAASRLSFASTVHPTSSNLVFGVQQPNLGFDILEGKLKALVLATFVCPDYSSRHCPLAIFRREFMRVCTRTSACMGICLTAGAYLLTQYSRVFALSAANSCTCSRKTQISIGEQVIRYRTKEQDTCGPLTLTTLVYLPGLVYA